MIQMSVAIICLRAVFRWNINELPRAAEKAQICIGRNNSTHTRCSIGQPARRAKLEISTILLYWRTAHRAKFPFFRDEINSGAAIAINYGRAVAKMKLNSNGLNRAAAFCRAAILRVLISNIAGRRQKSSARALHLWLIGAHCHSRAHYCNRTLALARSLIE
jgi:hypothetical protein